MIGDTKSWCIYFLVTKTCDTETAKYCLEWVQQGGWEAGSKGLTSRYPVSAVRLSPSALGKHQKQDTCSLVPLILPKSGSW